MNANVDKTLLIIGNGFDLQIGLKSSFEDFFKYINKEHLKEFSNIHSPINQYKVLSSIPLYSDPYKEINVYTKIKELTEYKFSYFNKNNVIIEEFKNINFWAAYFFYIKDFPNFNNIEDKFNTMESESIKNWSDVEYHINMALVNSKSAFELFNKICKSKDAYETQKSVEDYEQSFVKSGYLTYISVMQLITINLALICGWNFEKDDIYDFLFQELLEFELLFKEYLKKIIPITYEKKANELATLIAHSSTFNLVNFNYTTFYDIEKNNFINIHSNLEENGHPIIGISSNDGNREIYSEPYYKFSKTYRIMKLANISQFKGSLPSTIKEIIFYGHSLSHADYLYLDAILNKYNVIKNDIRLIFRYTNYKNHNGEIVYTEQETIESIYNFLNEFFTKYMKKSYYQQMLIENRIILEELPEFQNKIKNKDI